MTTLRQQPITAIVAIAIVSVALHSQQTQAQTRTAETSTESSGWGLDLAVELPVISGRISYGTQESTERKSEDLETDEGKLEWVIPSAREFEKRMSTWPANWQVMVEKVSKEPTSHSVRLRQLLATMTEKDIEIIDKVRSYVLTNIVVRDKSQPSNHPIANTSLPELLELQALGILTQPGGLGLKFNWSEEMVTKGHQIFSTSSKAVVFFAKEMPDPPAWPVTMVTSLGKELLQLLPTDPDRRYLEWIVETRLNAPAKVEVRKLTPRQADGSIRITNTIEWEHAKTVNNQ